MFPPHGVEREIDMVETVMGSETVFRLDWPVNDFAAMCANLKMYFLINGNIFSTCGWRE